MIPTSKSHRWPAVDDLLLCIVMIHREPVLFRSSMIHCGSSKHNFLKPVVFCCMFCCRYFQVTHSVPFCPILFSFRSMFPSGFGHFIFFITSRNFMAISGPSKMVSSYSTCYLTSGTYFWHRTSPRTFIRSLGHGRCDFPDLPGMASWAVVGCSANPTHLGKPGLRGR